MDVVSYEEIVGEKVEDPTGSGVSPRYNRTFNVILSENTPQNVTEMGIAYYEGGNIPMFHLVGQTGSTPQANFVALQNLQYEYRYIPVPLIEGEASAVFIIY